jgi:small subunit ribosomal protein S6
MPSLVPSSEDTRIYELCLLYPYPFGQKEENDLLKEVEGLFEEVGGKQVAKDKWGRRGLAYPIKGATEGNFVIYYYDLDPAQVKEIDRQLRIMKGVLRHMFVKPPKNYQILKYSEVYEEWLKNRESVEEVRARQKEEKVKEQVAKKAKRQVQKAADEKKAAAAKPMQEDVLTEKLEKLISDDTLDI